MRIFTLSTAVAVGLACRASAAVAVIPSSEGASVVVERPGVIERAAGPEPVPNAPFPISVFASIVAGMVHQEACIENGWSDVEDCPVTIIGPGPRDVAPVTTGAPAPIAAADDVATDKTEEADVEEGLKSPSNNGTYAPLGSMIASYAHSLACAKAEVFNAFCASTLQTNSSTVGDGIEGRAVPTTTRWVTVESTSTIAQTTTTVYLTPTSASSAFAGPAAPHVAMQTELSTSTVTNPTHGVSIVETTVIKTVTYNPSTDPLATVATNAQDTTTCTNNTAIDTQTYLNISTFSMASWTYSPAPNSTSTLSKEPYFTHGSGLTGPYTTKLTTVHTTTHTASSSAVLASTTTTLGSAAGKSTVDVAGFYLPTVMLVAMAACFVLALFL